MDPTHKWDYYNVGRILSKLKETGLDWAKEEKVQSYLIFLLEIDKDFKGVKDLKLEKGAHFTYRKGTRKTD